MRRILRVLDRLLPALLIASSVTLLAAGLLSYAPSQFGEWQTPDPITEDDPLLGATPDGVANLPSAFPTELPSQGTVLPSPSVDPLATPLPSIPVTPTPWSSPPVYPPPSPTAPPPPPPPPADGVVATRIVIPSLGIDLPVVPGDLVVRGNRNFYPLCDVAMYMPSFSQPGVPGATYIYAHAQRGMFAPLLKQSQINDGASMVGALIEVYTNDNMLHLYELFKVKRHATDLSLALNTPPGEHRLVLQTSEGVTGTVPKLQVGARPLTVIPASHADANPTPRPRVCLPRSGPYAAEFVGLG